MGMDLTLGINLGFAVNRYIEPEAWARIVGEDLGLRSVQLVADLINPFWPKGYLDDQVGRIKRSTEEYGISVDSVFTCSYTRVNHLLNPDAEARRFWLAWFKEFLEIGARLGAKTGGSHFGIMTFGTYDDPARRQAVLEEGVKGWRELVAHATRLGYESVIFEPMSVPREMANTIEDTLAILDMVNGGGGVPFGVCLDVGHAPHPDQRDPYPWIERLGAVSPVIHLQQTELNKSHHWPFTKEFNDKGIISAEKVIAAMEKAGAKKADMVFEIGFREHWDTDFRIVGDLKESVDYWRGYVSK